jgi:hypothetical protein|tara:strand:+ start:674 stop:874 length:201 start_codon:yes stop_codon:yes gene_type:complete
MVKLYKGSTWFNKNKEKEVFGIKIKIDGKWFDAGDNDGVLFFDTKTERNKKIDELKLDRLTLLIEG